MAQQSNLESNVQEMIVLPLDHFVDHISNNSIHFTPSINEMFESTKKMIWDYNNRFKVIITVKDEENEVNEFLNQVKSELEKGSNDKSEFTETLCCCYICDDPDNPVLTNYPITVYSKDGTTYTNKMCRDCLVANLQVATESFYIDGKINQDELDKISIKPAVIPSLTSEETKDGEESWPQIPLGQMISVLMNNNDDELTALTSAWLHGVSEYAVRVQVKNLFTFCPDHPHKLFTIKNYSDRIKCNVAGCKNQLCPFCNCWHESTFMCSEKKSGKAFEWNIKCPKCLTPTFKDGGFNHITCPCGCHWCYKCGKGFKTDHDCYRHLFVVHGGCFDYQFDD